MASGRSKYLTLAHKRCKSTAFLYGFDNGTQGIKGVKTIWIFEKHGLIWELLGEVVTIVNKKILVSCIQKGGSYNLDKVHLREQSND